MKKNRLFSLLFISVLFTACQESSNTAAPSMTTPLPAPAVTATNTLGDPNFVETKDTVSVQGPKSITRNILQDLNGHYWLATWEGLIQYDGKQYTNFTLKAGLKKYHVFSIAEQRNGTLWFGLIGGGVYRYDGQTFTQLTTANGLINNVVECILEDNTGNIWFGTENGVSRYDGHSFSNFTTKEGLCNDHINAMIEDKMGTIWFATRGGVCTFDGQFFTNVTNEKGVNFSHVTSIIEDRSGKIWVGSQDGLCRIDGNNKTSISKESIGSIFEDKKGHIWIAVSQREKMVLSRYDGKSVTEVKNDIQVFGITGDKAGKIWYGTTHGVVHF